MTDIIEDNKIVIETEQVIEITLMTEEMTVTEKIIMADEGDTINLKSATSTII